MICNRTGTLQQKIVRYSVPQFMLKQIIATAYKLSSSTRNYFALTTILKSTGLVQNLTIFSKVVFRGGQIPSAVKEIIA